MKSPKQAISRNGHGRKGKSYPYTIPPIECPDSETVKTLSPWYILEFFRIEALLRSETVMNLYETTFTAWDRKDQKTDTFMATYKVVGGWRALEQVHHRFFLYQDHPELLEIIEDASNAIDYDSKARYPAPGIVNLRDIIEYEFDNFEVNILGALRYPEQHGLKKKPRALWLALDPALSPAALINGLRPILKKEHQYYKNMKGRIEDPLLEASWPWPTDWSPYRDPRRKRPPIFGFKGIKTWLGYLNCYDLRYCEGLAYGDIARRVYGVRTGQTRDRAEQGFKRVGQLIRAAEKNNWPPSIR